MPYAVERFYFFFKVIFNSDDENTDHEDDHENDHVDEEDHQPRCRF